MRILFSKVAQHVVKNPIGCVVTDISTKAFNIYMDMGQAIEDRGDYKF